MRLEEVTKYVLTLDILCWDLNEIFPIFTLPLDLIRSTLSVSRSCKTTDINQRLPLCISLGFLFRIVTRVFVAVQGIHYWILYNNHGLWSYICSFDIDTPGAPAPASYPPGGLMGVSQRFVGSHLEHSTWDYKNKTPSKILLTFLFLYLQF